MIRLLILVMILAAAPVTAQEQWLHMSGVSRHDRPGFQERNWGLGWETRMAKDWSVAAGAYRNSLDRTSVYGLAKYHWIKADPWSVNVNAGAVTGYDAVPVAPVVLPELCVAWLCGMVIPRVGPNQATAVAVYLRIPL